MIRNCILFFLFAICVISNGFSQTNAIVNSENYYAIDSENKMILCHSSFIDDLQSSNSDLKEIKLENYTYSLIDTPSKLEQTKSYKVLYKKDTLTLYFTSLPIIKITSKQEIKDEPKNMARFTYADSTATYNEAIGIELRGNSALQYPKKSYDLEIRIGDNSEESKNLSFGDLRKDDDWILNSLYNEPLKLRSYFSTKLWLALTNRDDAAKKINDIKYAEVFLNNKYQGLYLLSEQVDRKQLKIKKLANGVAKGLLYKGNGLDEATTFKSAPAFKNALPNWAGFEMKYPYENYDSHWEGIHQLVALVSDTDENFNTQIAHLLDVENAMDYYLLVNLLRATDNLGKNYFIARQDTDTPFYFVPWDLDGVFGNATNGNRMPNTDDILTNYLFDKLLSANPSEYRSKLKNRWTALRASHFSNESLTNQLKETYSHLENFRIYEREAIAWPAKNTVAEDVAYVTNWLEKRLAFLDAHFNEMAE